MKPRAMENVQKMDNMDTARDYLSFQFPEVTWTPENIWQYSTVLVAPEVIPTETPTQLVAVLDNATTHICVRDLNLLTEVELISGVTHGSAGTAPVKKAGLLPITLLFGNSVSYGMTTRAIHVPTLPPGVDVLLSVSSLLKEKVIMAALQRQESATMWLNFCWKMNGSQSHASSTQ